MHGTVLAHVCCGGRWPSAVLAVVVFRSVPRTGAGVSLIEEPGGTDGRGDHQEDRGRSRLWLHLGGGRKGVLLPPECRRELRRPSRGRAGVVRDRTQSERSAGWSGSLAVGEPPPGQKRGTARGVAAVCHASACLARAGDLPLCCGSW